MITCIVKTTDDWWLGRNQAGKTGLFPSQYVELKNSAIAPLVESKTLDTVEERHQVELKTSDIAEAKPHVESKFLDTVDLRPQSLHVDKSKNASNDSIFPIGVSKSKKSHIKLDSHLTAIAIYDYITGNVNLMFKTSQTKLGSKKMKLLQTLSKQVKIGGLVKIMQGKAVFSHQTMLNLKNQMKSQLQLLKFPWINEFLN